METPVWLTRIAVEAMHDDQLRRHGGLPGIRDAGGLDAALARPQQRFAYDETADIARLAAAYAFGIARNHPFLDGNKRTAFIAMAVFLGINGQRLVAPQADAVVTMLALAAGDLNEDTLADWIRTWTNADV